MYFNPFLAQRLADERVRDALREAEQARLMRIARASRKRRGWWLPVASVLGGLLGLVTRPQG